MGHAVLGLEAWVWSDQRRSHLLPTGARRTRDEATEEQNKAVANQDKASQNIGRLTTDDEPCRARRTMQKPNVVQSTHGASTSLVDWRRRLETGKRRRKVACTRACEKRARVRVTTSTITIQDEALLCTTQ